MTELPDGSGCFTATIMSKEDAMALPLKERPLCYRLSSELYHAVFEHIGEASMCWQPKPGSEVFDSNKASDVAVRLCFKIAEAIEAERNRLEQEKAGLVEAISKPTPNGCTWAEYIHYQFPATVGHIPLNEWLAGMEALQQPAAKGEEKACPSGTFGAHAIAVLTSSGEPLTISSAEQKGGEKDYTATVAVCGKCHYTKDFCDCTVEPAVEVVGA